MKAYLCEIGFKNHLYFSLNMWPRVSYIINIIDFSCVKYM